MRKGREGRKEPHRIPSPFDLFFNDGLDRADLRAGATFGAFFFIDHVRLALFNGLDRTLLGAGPACHAFVGYDISHFDHLLLFKFRVSLFP